MFVMGFIQAQGIFLLCCLQQRKENAFQRKLHTVVESKEAVESPAGIENHNLQKFGQ